MEGFLKDTVSTEYLSTIPSRWASLLPRLARATQRLQRDDTQLSSSAHQDIQDCLSAAHHLLSEDHCIYEKGASLAPTLAHSHPYVSDAFDSVLQDMLVELCAREAVVAHWGEASMQLSSDQLRIYSHALLVRKVCANDVRRLLTMLGSTSA